MNDSMINRESNSGTEMCHSHGSGARNSTGLGKFTGLRDDRTLVYKAKIANYFQQPIGAGDGLMV